MFTLDLIRGVFPAFRGYSQALMIDEVRGASVSYYDAFLMFSIASTFDFIGRLHAH